MSIDDKETLVTMECDHCGCSDEVNPDEEPGCYFERIGYKLSGDEFTLQLLCESCSELFWTGFKLSEQMANKEHDVALAAEGHRPW